MLPGAGDAPSGGPAPRACWAFIMAVYCGNLLYQCNNFAGIDAWPLNAVRIAGCFAYGTAVLAILYLDQVDAIGIGLGVVMMAMVALFLAAASTVDVSGSQLLLGFIPTLPPMSPLPSAAAPCEMVLSLVGTTAIGFNVFLGGSMAIGKRLRDCRRGIAFSNLATLIVSVLIMVVGSGSAQSSELRTFDIGLLADAIQRHFGHLGTITFAVGFVAAALSSMLTTILGVVLAAEGLVLPPGKDIENGAMSKISKKAFWSIAVTMVCIAMTAIIANLPRPTVILVAQLFNGILLPVYSLALLFCVTDRRFMGSAPQTRCGNLSLVAAVTVTLILAWRVIIEKSAMILSLLVGVQFRVECLDSSDEGAVSSSISGTSIGNATESEVEETKRQSGWSSWNWRKSSQRGVRRSLSVLVNRLESQALSQFDSPKSDAAGMAGRASENESADFHTCGSGHSSPWRSSVDTDSTDSTWETARSCLPQPMGPEANAALTAELKKEVRKRSMPRELQTPRRQRINLSPVGEPGETPFRSQSSQKGNAGNAAHAAGFVESTLGAAPVLTIKRFFRQAGPVLPLRSSWENAGHPTKSEERPVSMAGCKVLSMMSSLLMTLVVSIAEAQRSIASKYEGQPLMITPNILTGILIGSLWIILFLVGLCCLFNVQTPSVFEDASVAAKYRFHQSAKGQVSCISPRHRFSWKAPSRSWSPEERSDTDAQAAILLQAHWRGTMVRRLHRKHLVSAAVLVAHLRAWHMGRQERKCFLRLKAAVLRLQRFLRERRSFQTEEELECRNHDGRLSVEECIDLKDGTWLFPDEESFEEVLDDTDRKFVDADRLWSLISDRLSNDASGEEWLRSQYRLLRSRRGEANWSPVASKTFTGSKSLVWSKSLSPAGSLESFWEDFCGALQVLSKQEAADMLKLEAVGLDGEALPLDLLPNATGREVYRALTERLPLKEGARVCVQIGREKISLRKAVKDRSRAEGEETWPSHGGCEGMTRSKEGVVKDEWALPSSLESLTFGIGFNRSLDHVSLPDGLKHLTFGTFFNKSLEQVHLPELESLVFGMKFDQSLEEVVLPGTLQHLAFGDGFNQPLDHVILPEGLLSLTFGNHFNQSLEAVLLPSSLKSLTFGNHFNQSLESLPFPSLENLTFGAGFVESLDRIHLPSSLQSLTLGLLQEVDGVTLPDRLKSLTFGDYFDQTLESVSLPESLQELSFGYDFNRSLRGVTLPSGLRRLE
eukprot:g28584.t1